MDTYWNNKGKYQAVYSNLHKLIPSSGACSSRDPKLERLRKAGNAYYQLFNNGNASMFSRIFGVSGRSVLDAACSSVETTPRHVVEKCLDEMILAAAHEQWGQPDEIRPCPPLVNVVMV